MSRAASADAVGARPHRSAGGSRGREVRPRVSIGGTEGHLRRGARAGARTAAVLCEPRIPARPWNTRHPTRPPQARVHPLHVVRATRALDVPFPRSCHRDPGARTVRRQQHPARDRGRGARARHCPPSKGGCHRRAHGQSLVEVLDAYAPPARPFYAVHASGGRVSPAARAFLEIAKRHLEGVGGRPSAERR